MSYSPGGDGSEVAEGPADARPGSAARQQSGRPRTRSIPERMASPCSPSQLASIATASAGCPTAAAPAAVATVVAVDLQEEPDQREVEAGRGRRGSGRARRAAGGRVVGDDVRRGEEKSA